MNRIPPSQSSRCDKPNDSPSRNPPAAISVSVANQQRHVRLPKARIIEAVRVALASAGVRRAKMTVALIDDAHMQRLHRQFLHQDEPTDVLSFPMGHSRRGMEGEIVVSAERAVTVAADYGWTPEQELLLYVIHGALHLAGFDDSTPSQQSRMRRQELLCLRRLGISMPGKPRRGHPAGKRSERPPVSRSKQPPS